MRKLTTNLIKHASLGIVALFIPLVQAKPIAELHVPSASEYRYTELFNKCPDLNTPIAQFLLKSARLDYEGVSNSGDRLTLCTATYINPFRPEAEIGPAIFYNYWTSSASKKGFELLEKYNSLINAGDFRVQSNDYIEKRMTKAKQSKEYAKFGPTYPMWYYDTSSYTFDIYKDSWGIQADYISDMDYGPAINRIHIDLKNCAKSAKFTKFSWASPLSKASMNTPTVEFNTVSCQAYTNVNFRMSTLNREDISSMLLKPHGY